VQGPTIHSPRVPGAIHYFGSSSITPEAVSPPPALLRLLTASIESERERESESNHCRGQVACSPASVERPPLTSQEACLDRELDHATDL